LGFWFLQLIFILLRKNSNIPPKKISAVEKPRPSSIGGFYHFATVGNHWKSVIHEQMLLAG
jgi:hypothetical protein